MVCHALHVVTDAPMFFRNPILDAWCLRRGIKARVSHDGSSAAMTAASSLITASSNTAPGHGEVVAARIRRWYLALQVWEGGTRMEALQVWEGGQ